MPATGEQTVWPRQAEAARGNPRTFAKQSPIEGAQPQSKSADDLKAILRTMTAKTASEKTRVQSDKQSSLKGALAEVLKKSQDAKPQEPKMPVPKPAAAMPPRIEAPAPAAPVAPVVAAENNQQSKPFEIPEEQLRAILKGE